VGLYHEHLWWSHLAVEVSVGCVYVNKDDGQTSVARWQSGLTTTAPAIVACSETQHLHTRSTIVGWWETHLLRRQYQHRCRLRVMMRRFFTDVPASEEIESP
jgi:hypothetical protein